MTEPHDNAPAAEALPVAMVQEKSRFSIVWLIPLVALAIGAWLAYKTYSEKGPTIIITFKTAEGLEAGKTQIKYKDVELGQVKEIQLSENFSGVAVTAELVKGAEEYLTENTRFWVVRARIAAGQVTGLGTLFGGAYIGVDPVKEGKPARQFTGLEVPPVVTTGEPGRHFMLHAKELGSVQVGAPVYFRAIKVGEVVTYELDKDGQAVDIQVFVNAPHDQQVRINTRFWNASGLDVSLDASGVKVDTESFVSLMIGGIAFETPENLEPGTQAEEGTVFPLYRNRQSVSEAQYTVKNKWLLYFTGSVRGLAVGAPVEFRGIQIGQVTDLKLQLDLNKIVARIPVLIEVEPGRIELIGDKPSQNDVKDYEQLRRKLWNRLVAEGLRAQLKTGSLLTGALFVDLEFYPDATPQPIVWEGKYPQLPTVPTPLEEIRNVLTKVLNKLEQLPLEQMGKDLQASLAGLRQTIAQTEVLAQKLNSNIVPALSGTLDQAQKALLAAQKAINPDSPLRQDAERAIKELSAAARSIRVMADYLERHPEALLKGKQGSGR